MSTANARYARYIMFAVFGLFILYFISTSSLPDYNKYTQLAPNGQSSDSLNKPPLQDPFNGASGSNPFNPPKEQPVSEPQATLPASLPPKTPVIQPELAETAPGERANATFVTLARNSDLWEIARSIRQVEDRFNRKYNYPWVFLNDKPFDETFKKVTTSLVSGKTYYGEIPVEHWSFPSWIDQDRARKVREDMAAKKIIYGDSISYRHMCRFESGFFFRQKIMEQFEYYWRVEPSIEYFCDIHYDPFKMMKDAGKKYSFVISLYEYIETIPTLWDSVKKFTKSHPEYVAQNNAMGFLSDDNGETYNKCHFWSNFEIGSLDWLRSKQYLDFFEALDQDGGFFYERWGDAPVHSIAAGLMLDKKDIHFFNDIAYYHVPFTHCPTGEDLRQKLRCHCDPNKNFDWRGYSCTSRCWVWIVFKSAVFSAIGCGALLLIGMNIPSTRRRMFALADKVADWHSAATGDQKADWHSRNSENDQDEDTPPTSHLPKN